MANQCGGWKWDASNEWSKNLQKNSDKNKSEVDDMANDNKPPLNYYAAYQPVSRDFERRKCREILKKAF